MKRLIIALLVFIFPLGCTTVRRVEPHKPKVIVVKSDRGYHGNDYGNDYRNHYDGKRDRFRVERGVFRSDGYKKQVPNKRFNRDTKINRKGHKNAIKESRPINRDGSNGGRIGSRGQSH